MTPHKDLAFFDFFFELVTPDRDSHKMTTHENSRSRLGGAVSFFNGQSLVKK
jgi:hypothetical protein